jgi:hypothetical protein
MTVSEFRFVVFDDPLLAAISIAGGLCFVGGAVMRLRGGRRWDRVILAGALLIAAAFVYTLVGSWLSTPG